VLGDFGALGQLAPGGGIEAEFGGGFGVGGRAPGALFDLGPRGIDLLVA